MVTVPFTRSAQVFRMLLVVAMALSFSAIHANADKLLEPGVDQLIAGQKGKIRFATFDAPKSQHWYAIKTSSYRLHPSTASGTLTFPKNLSQKVPAIVIMHDSSGVQANHEHAWAKFFNQLGYAAFVVDSFKDRGVVSTVRDAEAVTEESMVIDAFQALKLLSTHPDIDKDRIAVTGYSKGAIVSYFSSWQFFQKRLSTGNLKFAAHLPVYGSCMVQEENLKLTGAPILFLSAGKDSITPAKPCSRFVANAKLQNVDANIIIYPNVQHSFDDPSSPPGGDQKAWNSSACLFAVDYDSERGFRPNYDGPWTSWSSYDTFWKGCFKRGNHWGYNKAAAAQAHIDAKVFLQRVFGK